MGGCCQKLYFNQLARRSTALKIENTCSCINNFHKSLVHKKFKIWCQIRWEVPHLSIYVHIVSCVLSPGEGSQSLLNLAWYIGRGWIEGGSIFVFPIFFGTFRQPSYTPCILWCAHFGALIQFALTYQKNIYIETILATKYFIRNANQQEMSKH